MEKYGFVYIWRDRKYNRYYVGCHLGREDDGYICSSSWMSSSYKKRPQDFKRRILVSNIKDRKHLLEEEYYWLKMIKPKELGRKYYNLHNHHFGHWSTEENSRLKMCEKLSISLKKYYQEHPEFAELISKIHKESGRFVGEKNPFYGKTHSEETIQLISKTKKENGSCSGANNAMYGMNGEKSPNWGKPCLEKTRKLISKGNKGKKKSPLSEKTKKKISESKKGIIFSEERKLNISKSLKDYFKTHTSLLKGKKHDKPSPRKGIPRTEEEKLKISKGNKGKKHSEETKLKKSKTYLIISPDGEMFMITNKKQFCLDNGLNESHITDKSGSKGWKASKIII